MVRTAFCVMKLGTGMLDLKEEDADFFPVSAAHDSSCLEVGSRS